MLRFTAVEGGAKKYYIHVSDAENKEDKEAIKVVESVVSRTEYMPFIKSMNKNVRQSYWLDKGFIPAQFQQDLVKALQPVVPYKVEIKNSHILYHNGINKDEFHEYMETLTLPEKYDIFKEEYWHQMASVYRAILMKVARIEVGTSGGKTMIIYLYCRYLIDNILPKDKKILIIVPRQLLAKQTQNDFIEYDKHNDTPLIVETIYSGSKRVENAQVVVGTYQSLCDYEPEYFDDFMSVMCDEVQSAKSNSIRNGIYSKCRKTEWFFGLTGTYPKYNTLDYLNIVSMFGPLVLVKKTKELIADGNATPVFINRIKIHYGPENEDFSKNLKASGFTGIDKYRIEKKFFQTYEPRNRLMTKIINHYKFNHLILVESVEYCLHLKEYIKELCPDRHVDIIYGAVKGRDNIILDMKSRHDMILIATYETMSTGVSVNNIMHLHFPDGGRSEIRIKQSTGRILRLHELKVLANVWDYQDMMIGSSFKNHATERNKIFDSEGHPFKDSFVTI